MRLWEERAFLEDDQICRHAIEAIAIYSGASQAGAVLHLNQIQTPKSIFGVSSKLES